MSISTKKGDFRLTDLKDQRVYKYDDRVEAIGLIDDTIAHLLLADSYCSINSIQDIILGLSNIAGYIAGYCQLNDLASLTTKLEDYINNSQQQFQFVYRYKQTAKLHVNLARTKVRDLERFLTKLDLKHDEIYRFINRLSDFCYIIYLS